MISFYLKIFIIYKSLSSSWLIAFSLILLLNFSLLKKFEIEIAFLICSLFFEREGMRKLPKVIKTYRIYKIIGII